MRGFDMMSSWGSLGLGRGIGLLLIWSLVWKGMALWRAAKEDSKPWFVILLVVNTMGILEIIYLFFVAQEKMSLNKIFGTTSATPKPKTKSSK